MLNAPRQSVPRSLPAGTSDTDWSVDGARDLVVGDLVFVAELSTVPIRDERIEAMTTQRPVKRHTAGGRSYRTLTQRQTLAVVVDAVMRPFGRSEPTRTLVLEVLKSRSGDPDAHLPVGRRWILRAESINSRMDVKLVRKRVGSGPGVGTDDAGRAMRMSALLDAAGPDPVERLRLVVDPCRAPVDGSAETIGRTMASLVVSGVAPVQEWMLRQLLGTDPIPEARDYDQHQDAIMAEWDREEAEIDVDELVV